MKPRATVSSLDLAGRMSVAMVGQDGGSLLTVAACRRILGPECTASDDEIRKARDVLTTLAHMVLDLDRERP
jgi:hypothetical protein